MAVGVRLSELANASVGDDEKAFAKRAALFKRNTPFDAKVVAFHHDEDFACTLHYKNEDGTAGENLVSYDINGVKEANTTHGHLGEPKVTLVFHLDASGISQLIKAEAIFTEEIEVVIPPKKKSKSKKDRRRRPRKMMTMKPRPRLSPSPKPKRRKEKKMKMKTCKKTKSKRIPRMMRRIRSRMAMQRQTCQGEGEEDGKIDGDGASEKKEEAEEDGDGASEKKEEAEEEEKPKTVIKKKTHRIKLTATRTMQMSNENLWKESN